MRERLIDVLTDFPNKTPWDQFTGLAGIVLPVLGGVWALYLLLNRMAKRRYDRDIREADELRAQLKARDETLREQKSEIETLIAEVKTLEAKGPIGFLKQIEVDRRDGNREHEIARAETFLADQSVALFQSYSILCDACVAEASKDGAPSYENARRFALAALLIDPSDEDLRDLAEELRAAAAAESAGAHARLPTAEERQTRRERRNHLPQDFEALTMAFERAKAKGQGQLMYRLSEHAHRMALRATGPASEETLTWQWRLAESEQFLGRYLERAERCEAQIPISQQALGPDHFLTLFFRFQQATGVSGSGNPSKALKALRSLLPDTTEALGKDHPHTFTTRYAIAACLRDIGELQASQDALRDLLPDRERVHGKDHPRTFTTRSALALSLLDLDRRAEAAEIHAGVTDALRARGLLEEHRYVKKARAVDARIAAGSD
jgi:hypothetical protein